MAAHLSAGLIPGFTQISSAGSAGADARAGFREIADFALRHVNHVYSGEVGIKDSFAMQARDGAEVEFRQARFEFGGLFGYVHVDFHTGGPGVFHRLKQVRQGDRANAVGRDSDPGFTGGKPSVRCGFGAGRCLR